MAWGTIIGGWSAAANGLQPGKYVELEVTQSQAPNGAKFNSFSIMKRFQSKKPESLGEWKPTFTFRMDDHAQIVERLNYLIQHFCGNTGKYVFVPHVSQQPQAYPQTPQQPYPAAQSPQGPYPGSPVAAPQGYQQPVQQQQPVAPPLPVVPVTNSGW